MDEAEGQKQLSGAHLRARVGQRGKACYRELPRIPLLRRWGNELPEWQSHREFIHDLSEINRPVLTLTASQRTDALGEGQTRREAGAKPKGLSVEVAESLNS